MNQKERNVKNAIMELIKKADPNASGEVEVSAGDDYCKVDIKTDTALNMDDLLSTCGYYTDLAIRPEITITNGKGEVRKSIFAKRRK